jgi:hypothetical protein
MTRSHRVLVYLDDYDEPEVYGYWCTDCDLEGFGSPTDIYPKRVQKKHMKQTRVLEVAS